MRETFTMDDVLNVLIELESKGYSTYMSLSGITDDEKMSTLFSRLAHQELNHKHLYEKILAAHEHAEPIDAEYAAYAGALLKSQVAFLDAPVPADFESGYKMALQLERDTIFFLTELAPILGKHHREELDFLIAEERRHLIILMEHTHSRNHLRSNDGLTQQ